jgi:hypothetical protein
MCKLDVRLTKCFSQCPNFQETWCFVSLNLVQLLIIQSYFYLQIQSYKEINMIILLSSTSHDRYKPDIANGITSFILFSLMCNYIFKLYPHNDFLLDNNEVHIITFLEVNVKNKIIEILPDNKTKILLIITKTGVIQIICALF